MSRGKDCKRFGPLYQHKRQAEGTIPNKGDTQKGKTHNIKTRESSFMVLKQIIVVPWTEYKKVVLWY